MERLLWLSLMLAGLLLGCQAEGPIATPTQVAVRLSADEALKAHVTVLRARASIYERRGWSAPVMSEVTVTGLSWPIDLPVYPRNSDDESKSFEVVVEAFGGGQRLAQARAVTAFKARAHLVLDLRLFICPRQEANYICAADDCRGPQCEVCTESGVCEAVGITDHDTLVVVQAGSVDAASGIVQADGAMPRDADGEVGLEAGSVVPPGLVPVPEMDGRPDIRADAGLALDGTIASAMEAGGEPSEAGVLQPTDTGPTPECTEVAGCSPGYNCVASRCVSACTQTTCPENATCSLRNGAPSCACVMGYLAQGTGTSMTCVRDFACNELNCSPNATCEVQANQLRQCKCANGYNGNGMTCTPVSCGMPTLANGTVSISGDGSPTYMNRATFTCNPGYERAVLSASSATCGADGMWSATGSCAPIDCGSPGTLTRGSVTTSNGNRYMSVATFSCSSGATLSGASTRTCQANATWSGSVPTCLYCGDRIITAPMEDCDPGIGNLTAWACPSTTCRRSTAYQACRTNSDCLGGGELCALGFCVAQCGTSSCPPVPADSGATPVCMNGGCVLRCSSNASCPPGLLCHSGTCAGCSGAAGGTPACPTGQQCIAVGSSGLGSCF